MLTFFLLQLSNISLQLKSQSTMLFVEEFVRKNYLHLGVLHAKHGKQKSPESANNDYFARFSKPCSAKLTVKFVRTNFFVQRFVGDSLISHAVILGELGTW